MYRDSKRQPDFRNMQLILDKKIAPRPVMFDFIIGDDKEKLLTGTYYKNSTEFERVVTTIKAFDSGGYDHSPIIVRGLTFDRNKGADGKNLQTKSLNEGTVITDRASFDAYKWPEITDCDFSIIEKAGEYMPKGMKMIPFSMDGILENTIGILGYENLCMLLYDDESLISDVFENVGKRLVQYFEKCIEYKEVGAVLCNDDWGFKTQTMLPPSMLKKYVFPWYKQLIESVHKKGKHAILHSCGYYRDIIGDIVDYMKFDGKHSFEDNIIKVEEAYDELHTKIAVMGGIDVDFLARANASEVYERCKNMLKKSQAKGGYVLGSGNSVPDYISDENYLAMLKAGNEDY